MHRDQHNAMVAAWSITCESNPFYLGSVTKTKCGTSSRRPVNWGFEVDSK